MIWGRNGTFFTGQWFTNPNYNRFQGKFSASDPGDGAVIVLDEPPPGITPAQLPPAGMLDDLKAANTLTKAWLTLPMLPMVDSGGTCYGDSGGPHFIHLDGVETNIVASITVTGDAPCKATDKTYRMDTASAREFLGNFVELP